MTNRRAFGGFHVALAVVGAVGVGALFYKEAVGPNLAPKRFAVVEPGKIFRSGKVSPAALRRVHEAHGLRTIIDFGAYPAGSPEDLREQRAADSLGISRYRFDLSGDSTGNANAYVVALRMITDPAHQPVLIHCGAGTERTGCAVILYRHILQDVPLEEAYKEAEAIGHSRRRNPRLSETLRDWAGPIEEAYRSGGQIPGADPIPEPPLPGSVR
jgi:protein tyrosine/serine phosphatase